MANPGQESGVVIGDGLLIDQEDADGTLGETPGILIFGEDPNLKARALKVNTDGNIALSSQTTAFGELSIAELTPVFQGEFSYNINTKLWSIHTNTGTATVDSNRAKLSTGAGANQSTAVLTRTPIKYHPGQGALIRYTTIYTTGVANSIQMMGVGDSGDGYFFGYNGADFGVLRRVGGNPEIRTLTITTKSTTAEDITITLDGDADVNVTVTDATAGDVTTTANDIATHDFSNLGRGWSVHTEGPKVIFTSYNSTPRTGTYSLSGASTAVGTFARTLAGVTPTDTWTTQANWNGDTMDGAGNSGMILDQTKGNIYQIRYQWLGFGDVEYYIKSQATNEWTKVHTISYANQNTTPSVYNPSLPICAMVENTSNTSDIVMYTSSVGGFIEGKTNGGHVHHGAENAITSITTTELPILTIHNKEIYQSKINRNQIKLIFADISCEHTKPMRIRFRFNATLTGASFVDVDTNDSMMSEDTSATAVSGGDIQLSAGLAKSDSRNISLADTSFFLNPGDSLTVTAEATSGTGGEATGSFNWEELF